MSYNVIAVNPGHNGSAALVSDDKLVCYIEEERLTRVKYDGNPVRAVLKLMEMVDTVDELVICGTMKESHRVPWTGEDSIYSLIRKFHPNVKLALVGDNHHDMHIACGFYNSGFDKAIVIVVDGAGSMKRRPDDADEGYEVETVAVMEYPHKIELIVKNHGNNYGGFWADENTVFDDTVSFTKAYEAVSQYLGFGFIEAGKTMGLASYGTTDSSIPALFKGNRGSKDVFIPYYPAGAFIDQVRNPSLQQKEDPKEWHTDPSKLPDVAKNLAYAIQKETQERILQLIETSVKATGIKNVVLVGGYALNCVANYFYKKNIEDINLYVEPIAHDGGTAIGAAKLFSRIHSQSTEIDKQTSLYYGINYNSFDKTKINSEEFNVEEVQADRVAELLANRKIVSLFQGGAEAGPRALGNRSILYDPRDPNGKEYVNRVKGREWFRPFAGTVLKEHASEWFDMAGLEESPFMMYAVDVLPHRVIEIPAITHVDNTCRVQTVTREQNKVYYDIIEKFYSLTNVPIIFNTSFNLAGEPLVETVEDALDTLKRSEIDYLYLADYNLLVSRVPE